MDGPAATERFNYEIFDYTSEDPDRRLFATPEKVAFQREVEKRTEGFPVRKSQIYQNPLDRFLVRKLDKLSFNCKIVRAITGQKENIFRAQHRYFVFDCERENERENEREKEKKKFISLEKNQSGITLQISGKSANVIHLLRGKKRKNENNVYGSEVDHGDLFNLLQNLKKIRVSDIIDNLETVLEYALTASNCQSLVNEVVQIFTQISESVKIKFPGTVHPVSFDRNGRERICALVEEEEARFSDDDDDALDANRFVPLALVEDAEDVALPEDQRSMYRDFQSRDRLSRCIVEFLKNYQNPEEMAFCHNMYRKKMMMKLEECATMRENPLLTEDLCRKMASFWTTFFDGAIFSKEHGVIVVQINVNNGSSSSSSSSADDDRSPEFQSNDDAMSTRRELIGGLLRVGLSEGEVLKVPISSVVIGIRTVRREIRFNESQLEFSVTESDVEPGKGTEEGGFLNESLKSCLSRIRVLNKKSEIDPDQLKFGRGKLHCLQSFVNADSLLFARISNQRWLETPNDDRSDHRATATAALLWSREQRLVVDLIWRHIFSEDSKLNLTILGCAGSGKTLILIKSVEEYLSVERYATKKVIFVVPDSYEILEGQLREKIRVFDKNGRVAFQPELPKELGDPSIGLIVHDELTKAADHRLRWEEFSAHFIGVSMETNWKCDCEDCLGASGCGHTRKNAPRNTHACMSRNLGKSNFRSSEPILKMVDYAQRCDLGIAYGNLRMELNSKLTRAFSQKPVDCKDFTDYTLSDTRRYDTRDRFVRSCVEDIVGSTISCETLVYNLCHVSLLTRVQSQLRTDMLEANRKEEFDNLIFSDPYSAQGAEFMSSIGLVDPMSMSMQIKEALIVALTRTFMDSKLLINCSTKPYALTRLGLKCPSPIRNSNDQAIQNDVFLAIKTVYTVKECKSKVNVVWHASTTCHERLKDELKARDDVNFTEVRSYSVGLERKRDVAASKNADIFIDVSNVTTAFNASLSFMTPAVLIDINLSFTYRDQKAMVYFLKERVKGDSSNFETREFIC